MLIRRKRCPRWRSAKWSILVAGCAVLASAQAGPVLAQERAAEGRMQLHRNGMRSVPYLSLASGQSTSAARIRMQPANLVDLDGDALANVRGNLFPIDVDGNGTYEFLHFNGFRFMRVYRADGRKLWEIRNPNGRLHRSTMHRDTLAVFDGDRAGRQYIVHCWTDQAARRKRLVVRRGQDGAVLRSVDLDGSAGEECQMAAFRVPGRAQPIVLVSHQFADRSKCRVGNWVDQWARTVAFDLDLNRLWDSNTCHAGHYVYPVDADRNGVVEAIFIGRHVYEPDGRRRCTMPGWGGDHADAVAVGDLMPGLPGLEAVAIGTTGTRAVRVANCQALWTIPTRRIRSPQNLALAKLDRAGTGPQIVISERGSLPAYKTFVVSGAGKIVATFAKGAARNVMPMQNANLDGARGTDELVGSFGVVLDGRGTVRLDKGWYWGRKGQRTREVRGEYPTSYDRWAPFPLVADLDHDGRDEVVTWSQSLIAVGKVVN